MGQARAVTVGDVGWTGVELTLPPFIPRGFVAVSAVDSGLARTCTGCGKPLSRYNKQKLCQACVRSGRANNRGRRAEGRAPLVDAAKLVQLRNNHGWTQEMLAGYAGLSCDMVKKLEQGPGSLHA